MLIKFNLKKLPEQFMINCITPLLFGMLGAMVILSIAHVVSPPQRQIATVNITAIINQYVKSEANKEITPAALKKEVDEFGGSLEKTIKNMAQQNNIILVPSEAVIAGARDYTDVIRQKLQS